MRKHSSPVSGLILLLFLSFACFQFSGSPVQAQLAGTLLPPINDAMEADGIGNSTEPLTKREIDSIRLMFKQLSISKATDKTNDANQRAFSALKVAAVRKQLDAMGPRVIPELIRGLASPNEAESSLSAVTLTDFRQPQPIIDAVLAKKLPADSRFLPGILISIGEKTIPLLAPLLKSDDADARLLALVVPAGLFALPDSQGFDNALITGEILTLMSKSLDDTSAKVRAAAVLSLSGVNPIDKSIVLKVQEKLKADPDVSVRQHCALLLDRFAQVQHPELAPEIEASLLESAKNDADHRVRLAAASMLQQIHTRQAIAAGKEKSPAALKAPEILDKEFGVTDEHGHIIKSTMLVPFKIGESYGVNLVIDSQGQPVHLKIQLALPSPAKEWNILGVPTSEDKHTVSADKMVGTYEGNSVPLGITDYSWTILDGDPVGHYSIKIWLNDRLLATYNFTVAKE